MFEKYRQIVEEKGSPAPAIKLSFGEGYIEIERPVTIPGGTKTGRLSRHEEKGFRWDWGSSDVPFFGQKAINAFESVCQRRFSKLKLSDL